MQNTETC